MAEVDVLCPFFRASIVEVEAEVVAEADVFAKVDVFMAFDVCMAFDVFENEGEVANVAEIDVEIDVDAGCLLVFSLSRTDGRGGALIIAEAIAGAGANKSVRSDDNTLAFIMA